MFTKSQQDQMYGQTADHGVENKERRWNRVRLLLGVLQMFGAVCSITLLVETGISVIALVAVMLTGVLTTTSILLFGARRSS